MSATISTDRFKELLAKVKQQVQARKDEEHEAAINSIETSIEHRQPIDIDLSATGITREILSLPEGEATATEILREITEPRTKIQQQSNSLNKTTGVAAEVALNTKQQQFAETALSGEDICFIGAAGTGKTTATGKFIQKLQEQGDLPPLGIDTKWLRASVPGILITSFTRKAVNNIRRAVPNELKPHVLTMHKILEFEPVFYEILDEKSGKMKNTMKFEPKRSEYNPLPREIKLVVYEESSMIGTDLYNQLAAALPHRPQEIFIGDIRQLPPIFGPAILGFKMSLLPVVELTEVYRQALLSPIIRLAHGILSGDARKFSDKIEEREEKHEFTGRVAKRKFVPSLEAFNESCEHGTVKFQIWQKKLPSETGCDTAVKQFIAWEKSGYYNPEEDIIICPFNKSFGTVELNKGIQNYLGQQRHALVHEIIAGFDKHYLAVGDRVLFDKEDAVITEIKRNISYLGKSVQAPSVHLDRWGSLQVPLSKEEQEKLEKEESDFDMDVIDKFVAGFSDDEGDRVNQASHAITIRFTYSDEVQTLSSAGEVNSLLGGNAITVHKMQGSEAEKVFLVLHHSHQMMVSNELLYTAVTRARSFLHIICETDTFFKGVKTQKVRGVTLEEKIDTFKGKVEFKEMQQEMEFLKKQREERKIIRAARERWKDEEKEKFTASVNEEEWLPDEEYTYYLTNSEYWYFSDSDFSSIEIPFDNYWEDYKEEMKQNNLPLAPGLSLREKLLLLRKKS